MQLLDNAKDVAAKAWSFKINLATALVSAVASSMPLWDPTQEWFSATNLISLGTFFSSVGAAFLRLVDQGIGKGTNEEADYGDAV